MSDLFNKTGRIPDNVSLPELTVRGIILGALITVVFTASNVYLGLKVGLTFSSAIPAAVISMAVLRMFKSANILENNMVQTQASAAGTLSSIIFILPGLVMIGYWQGFPYWQTLAICAAGGMLGVMFTIPLRHAMVVQSDLPYPEGVAAAEILRVGSAEVELDTVTGKAGAKAETGIVDIMAGGFTAAIVTLFSSGFRVLGEGINLWFAAGPAVVRLSAGFSLALLGAGYLIGIVAGIAMLIGLLIAWGVAVPVLTSMHSIPDGMTLAKYATGLWSKDVRFIGAGTIGVAAVWTLITLFKPMLEGVKTSFQALRGGNGRINIPRTERDLAPGWIIAITLVLVAILAATFASFLSAAPLSAGMVWGLVAYSVLFAVIFGFLIAAACGYMAGLIGSSASPISGVGIVAVVLISLLILLVGSGDGLLATESGNKLGIALAIFTTSAVIAVATISNDNLQDLKTGWLVGATPWRQQVALLIGCVVGAVVIPPVLELLYNAYGFAGAMPRAEMDVAHALSAPQATLMTAIATGIFTHQLNWNMILIGLGLGVVLVAVDEVLRRRGGVARLPVLAVGIGIYLPPTVASTLVLGTLLAWIIERILKKRAQKQGVPYEQYAEAPNRRGVLLASGLIVGESLVGVLLAAIIGFTGNDSPLALVGGTFENTAQWLGLIVFAAVAWVFSRRVLTAQKA
ncbi:putative oligopeptide transporter, OPT family [Collimonas sp. OK307]|uniref:OPT family oligopeptide transporter n=1 Tax=Collimonas sp. OK307 TaxID=1801620 RepID=UPI0008E6015A|nr:oligopeptide transporter, OPT family [Collimonas sp. OK307]SFH63460.1 putative oligopeptide transporter, OPT family [Collimonas sp. OK307]